MKKLSFPIRLSLVFLVVFIIPLTAIALYTYNSYRTKVVEQAHTIEERSLSQTASFLEAKITAMNNLIDTISYDATAQDLLKKGTDSDRDMQGNWFVLKTDIKNYYYQAYTANDFDAIQVFPVSGPNSLERSAYFRNLSGDEQVRLSNATERIEVFKPQWLLTQDGKHILLIKKIPDFLSINKAVGFIVGEIPQQVFQDVIDNAIVTEGTTIGITDSKGTVLACSRPEDRSLVRTVRDGLSASDGPVSDITADGKDLLAGRRSIEKSDWSLFVIQDMGTVLADARKYREQMLVLIAVIVAALIPTLILTSRNLTKRIGKLQDHIEQSKKQNFDIAPLDNGEDEIGRLTQCYNEMTKEIRTLLDVQFRLGYQINSLELGALQSAINPHFLSNTLDTIYWTAMDKGDAKSAAIASRLSKFFRLCLADGATCVPLKDEVEMVATYISIQNIRFDGKITFRTHIPQELENKKILKMILQPLVENSIIHGIREKDTESGTISIEAHRCGSALVISVADDGIGIAEERLDRIMKEKDRGYGLWNTDQRLKLLYGPGYGLSIRSVPHKGCTVILTLPDDGNTLLAKYE